MKNRKIAIGFRLLIIVGFILLLSCLIVGCGGGGGGGDDGDNDNSSSHILEGTYVSYVNKNELILKVTESNTSCFYPGNQLYYEIESISLTELVLREEDGDLFTWISNSNTNQGLLGTWINSEDLDDHLTFNADQTWYLDGTVDCSPIIYDSTFGSFEINGTTVIATDAIVNMNYSTPKQLQINITNNDEDPRQKLQLTSNYTSKAEFDNSFSNNTAVLNGDDFFYMQLENEGIKETLSESNFSLTITKNQDGSYDFYSEGTLVSYSKTWTVSNIIGENVSFVAINGY